MGWPCTISLSKTCAVTGSRGCGNSWYQRRRQRPAGNPIESPGYPTRTFRNTRTGLPRLSMRNVSFRLFIWFHRAHAAQSDDTIRCLSWKNNVFGQRIGDEFPSDFTTTEQPNGGTGELTSACKLSCGHFPICLHMGMDRHIESADHAEATPRNAISYVGFLLCPCPNLRFSIGSGIEAKSLGGLHINPRRDVHLELFAWKIESRGAIRYDRIPHLRRFQDIGRVISWYAVTLGLNCEDKGSKSKTSGTSTPSGLISFL
jgi:hypothetical protein